MAEFNQFGSDRGVGGRQCVHFEALLTDAIDGTLSPEEQEAFDLHVLGCDSCSAMLADARRGAAWMEMLRPHRPEPSEALLGRILAQTTGAPKETLSRVETDARSGAGILPFHGAMPAVAGQTAATAGNVVSIRTRLKDRLHLQAVKHTVFQPRLAMTAAMAFFSIALTLNLTGIKLSELKVSDLRPSSLKRSFYEANAHVVRYYDNLRVVYELESRVHDLQRTSNDDAAPAATNGDGGQSGSGGDGAQPKSGEPEPTQPKPRTRPGTSRRETRPAVSLAALLVPDALEGIEQLAPRIGSDRRERGSV